MQFDPLTVLAIDHAAFWLAGVLTVVASLIVVVVMLTTSRADDGDQT